VVKILGLTGGIGMGKSTASAIFRRNHVPVFDADAAVHALQARGGRAVAPIAAAFPDAVRDGVVVREALRRAVFEDPHGQRAALRRLERIVHPLVRGEERRFVAAARRRRRPLVVLDIPLLFETKGERRCDAVVVVSAPPAIQRARVLARPDMNKARLAAILKRQMPDRLRRVRADAVIHTGLSRHTGRRHILALLRRMR
jgi:dephospho-CoA kinase